jgi:hypothetical protein
MPTVDGSRIENELFALRRTDHPGERAAMMSFSAVGANEKCTIKLQILSEDFFSVALSSVEDRGDETMFCQRQL